MRINILIFYMVLAWGFVARAQAFDDFRIRTDLAMTSVLAQKPSSSRDSTSFKQPTGYVGVQWDPVDELGLETEVSLGKSRDSVSGRSSLQIEKAFFIWRSLWSETSSFEYGLLANPWVALQEKESWINAAFGTRYGPWGTQLNYFPRSDLGMGLVDEDENRRIELQVTNGEGLTQDEVGPRKDLQIFVSGMPFENFRAEKRLLLALNLAEGAYENIEAEVATRERLSILLKYEEEHRGWFLAEGLWTKDPADAINGKVAEQVETASLGGQSLRGAGYAGELAAWTGEKSLISYRYERFNPALGVDAKGLSSGLLGIHYFARQFLQFSLSWLDVHLDGNHAPGVRDTAEFLFGLRLLWTSGEF